jgi:delta-1-pyrroline-5-carboxylate synthetase
VQLDDVIDLVIPRGSNKLVSQIKAATKIPVLGHAGKLVFVIEFLSLNITSMIMVIYFA